MLADKDLLKKQLGTQLSDNELGFTKRPETIANPKKLIAEAINIVVANNTKRKRSKLSISELYDIIGSEIKVDKLESLPSFMKFKNNVRVSLENLLLQNFN